ncbi:MAG: hypothetical protein ABGX30_03570 [bacterium]
MSVFTKLNSVIDEKGAAYVVLIDPDRKNEDSLESHVDGVMLLSV